ncbi:MAG: hypothetical protein ACRDQ4_24320 [Pseudonocardiaceae bacterium]
MLTRYLPVKRAKKRAATVSDPQPVTANDVDTLRAIAERHANHPEVTERLYAVADYLAVLQRGQQRELGRSESIEGQPVVGDACPMKWAVHVKSVAAGNDVKEETCGQPASEPVEYDGVLYVVCPECKDELVNMGGRGLGETA